jgi:hypothetical protein
MYTLLTVRIAGYGFALGASVARDLLKKSPVGSKEKPSITESM